MNPLKISLHTVGVSDTSPICSGKGGVARSHYFRSESERLFQETGVVVHDARLCVVKLGRVLSLMLGFSLALPSAEQIERGLY